MLESMRNARSLPELEKLVPGLLEIVREAVLMLRSGKANPAELVIRRNISKEAGEYLNNSISAVISRMLESAGIHVAAGETVHFIIIDQSGKRNPEKAKPVGLYSLDDGYDSMKYTELVLKAAETLLLPFGYDFKTLGRMFQPNRRWRKRKIGVRVL